MTKIYNRILGLIDKFTPPDMSDHATDKPAAEKDATNAPSKSGKLSNNDIFLEITGKFQEQIENDSFADFMMYPMAVRVIMHENVLKAKKENFQFMVGKIVEEFYKIMEAKKSKWPDASCHADYWYFEFLPFSEEMRKVDGGAEMFKDVRFDENRLLTLWSVLPPKSGDDPVNVKVSLNLQDSCLQEFDINWNALSEITNVSNTVFTVNFDKIRFPDPGRPVNHDAATTATANKQAAPSAHANGLGQARIVWQDGSKVIGVPLLMISGSGETRQGQNMLVLDDPTLGRPHAQIRYDIATDTFMIAAYGIATVNYKSLELSQVGGDVKEYPLARKSVIMLGHTMKLEFEYPKKQD